MVLGQAPESNRAASKGAKSAGATSLVTSGQASVRAAMKTTEALVGQAPACAALTGSLCGSTSIPNYTQAGGCSSLLVVKVLQNQGRLRWQPLQVHCFSPGSVFIEVSARGQASGSAQVTNQ